MNVDAVIIGAGSGGYTAALRLSRIGKKVILVEKDEPGGVCLISGCIPSKALLHAAGQYHSLKVNENLGVTGSASLDLDKLMEWKDGIIEKSIDSIKAQCKSAGIEVIHGAASLLDDSTVSVDSPDGTISISAGSIIIATGSAPVEIPGFRFDGDKILNSGDILDMKKLPSSICIIGGGAIGVEIGTFLAKLGSKVTIVEALDNILPTADDDITRVITKSLKALGVDVRTGSTANSTRITPDGIIIKIGDSDLEFGKVLVVVGRKANIAGLGLEDIDVQLDDNGFVKVNEKMQTNVTGIYAIGDVVGGALLAHKASHDGLVVADIIAGREPEHSGLVPHVVYTDPETASVGLTEREAENMPDIVVKRYYFAALGKALTMNDTRGFVKIVASESSGKILGIHIVGNGASNLIGEAILAVEKGVTIRELAGLMHPHPSLCEALGEAARSMLG